MAPRVPNCCTPLHDPTGPREAKSSTSQRSITRRSLAPGLHSLTPPVRGPRAHGRHQRDNATLHLWLLGACAHVRRRVRTRRSLRRDAPVPLDATCRARVAADHAHAGLTPLCRTFVGLHALVWFGHPGDQEFYLRSPGWLHRIEFEASTVGSSRDLAPERSTRTSNARSPRATRCGSGSGPAPAPRRRDGQRADAKDGDPSVRGSAGV